MKALMVYESMFGNTAEIARAVSEGMAPEMDVDLREVNDAPAAVTDSVDLIVVGGPTHALSLSRASTRADAVRQGAPADREAAGLREWLSGLRAGPSTGLVATFDTRVARMRHLPGSAAKKATKLALALGYTPVARESFYVTDVAGPPLPGEVDRAREWGRSLADDVRARHDGRWPSRRP
jgi:flavodoxin